MATFNSIAESKGYFAMSCDGCGSNNIQETIQGYVCGECGLVLEVERLLYYRPYNKDVVQYATLSSTQIGSKKERYYSPYSHKLRSLNRLHIMKDATKRVFHNAKIEINRILSALDIPESFQRFILTNFKKVYSEFKPSTKYRSVEKLVPAILYYSLRDQNVPISVHKLLEVSKIEKSEFNHFRIQVGRYIKTRDSINRQLFISQKLLEIKDHFNLGMEFVFYTKKIMCRLWELIKNTTDNVIAGVSSSITVLCYYNEQGKY